MDEGTFCWVDIKRFVIDDDGSDEDLLATLIRHRQYQDHYAGQDPTQQAQHNLHGPYRLEAITPAVFEPSTPEQAREIIQSWADNPQPQPPHIRHRVEQRVYPLLSSGTLYRLPDLRATAQHEWGWVVGFAGFHEFVAIDRAAATLTLIVASDD